MEYKVIELSGKQYLLKAGQKITALGHLGSVGKTINAKTLLSVSDKTEIGTPYLTSETQLEVLEHAKSQKIDGFKYRSKSRYRRRYGHRQPVTHLQLAITTSTSKTSKSTSTPKITASKTPKKPNPKVTPKTTKATTSKKAAPAKKAKPSTE